MVCFLLCIYLFVYYYKNQMSCCQAITAITMLDICICFLYNFYFFVLRKKVILKMNIENVNI